MNMSTINYTLPSCPGCGGTLIADEDNKKQAVCKNCMQPMTIKSARDTQSMPAGLIKKYVAAFESAPANDYSAQFQKGICQLQLDLYDQAIASFERVIDNDFTNSDAYFYTCIALMNGEKAFLTTPNN